MYILKRKLGEKTILKTKSGDIEVVALESNRNNVRIGIKAEDDVLIIREEENARSVKSNPNDVE